ncbi:MAG: hypothetical protein Harvfovirus6_40 [Harvfovirus sp.]|uniref:Uncharacterized protein n=1 Tax=Harvfovirus sp. TaxID=2487768 RepID=A0A3G5A0X8_9VIRU|nr:MAG: hypothetical protein Harvfovirus6_40 [Harvfovirus sp.]
MDIVAAEPIYYYISRLLPQNISILPRTLRFNNIIIESVPKAFKLKAGKIKFLIEGIYAIDLNVGVFAENNVHVVGYLLDGESGVPIENGEFVCLVRGKSSLSLCRNILVRVKKNQKLSVKLFRKNGGGANIVGGVTLRIIYVGKLESSSV